MKAEWRVSGQNFVVVFGQVLDWAGGPPDGMGAVVHVPVEGAAVSSALGISTDRLTVLYRKVVINPEVVANLVDKDLEITIWFH